MFLLQFLQQMKGDKTTSRSDEVNNSALTPIPLPAPALYSERGPDVPLQLCHLFSSVDVSLSCQDRVQTPCEAFEATAERVWHEACCLGWDPSLGDPVQM